MIDESEARQLSEAVILLARKGQRLPEGEVRTCQTCAHQIGRGRYAHCARGGYYVKTVRAHARNEARHICDGDFSGWTPRPRPWWKFWESR